MQIRKIIILISLVVWSITLHAQRYTISGYITDKSNGETLISASVFDEISKKGTVILRLPAVGTTQQGSVG